MKKSWLLMPLVLFAFAGCTQTVTDVGETLVYPETITNDSVTAAIEQLNEWTSDDTSMSIVITGKVNQNLLLDLKEWIRVVEKNVDIAQGKDDTYTFTLDIDMSGMTGVTSFKECYFDGCTILGTIKLPDCFTEIPKYTFEKCTGLTSIEITSGISRIGYCAFADCTSLQNVTIHSEQLELGSYAFYDCPNISFTVDNSTGKIQITNALLMEDNPFAYTNSNVLSGFVIDEEYNCADSDSSYSCTHYVDDGKLMSKFQSNSEDDPYTKVFLVSYPMTYSLTYADESSSTNVVSFLSAYDISDIFEEGLIINPSAFDLFKADKGDNCNILTGGLPEGESLFCTTSFVYAVDARTESSTQILPSGNTITLLQNINLEDLSDIYDIVKALKCSYYIYVADTPAEEED